MIPLQEVWVRSLVREDSTGDRPKKIRTSSEEYPFPENNYIFQEERLKGLGVCVERISTKLAIVLVFLSPSFIRKVQTLPNIKFPIFFTKMKSIKINKINNKKRNNLFGN